MSELNQPILKEEEKDPATKVREDLKKLNLLDSRVVVG